MFLLYCGALEPNLQYLWGMPVLLPGWLPFLLLFIILCRPIFPTWCHRPSAWRTSFGISCSENLLLMNSFIFCMSEKVLFCLWKIFSMLIEFCLAVLYLQCFNDVAPPSSHLHYSQWEICCHLYLCLGHYNMSLLLPTPRLLTAFVILLFIVMVEQFEYDVLLHNFFLFVFFALASLSFLLCGLMVFFFTKFGKVLAMISSKFFFSIPLPLSSPSATPYRYIKLLDCLLLKFFTFVLF